MAQRLRALAALPEDPSLVPSTSIWRLTTPLTLAPGALILSFSFCSHVHTCSIHLHRNIRKCVYVSMYVHIIDRTWTWSSRFSGSSQLFIIHAWLITAPSSSGSREKVWSDPEFSEKVLGSLWLWIEDRLLTQVVDSDVHLKAVCGLRVGAHHHPCIVDENVEVLFLCRKRKQPWLSQLRNGSHNPA